MKKTLLLALLLATTNIAPLYAVQVTSQEDDDEALRRGRTAKNVCYISGYFGKDSSGKPLPLCGATGALIAPDILITAGHVVYDGLDDLVEDMDTEVDVKTQAQKTIDALKEGKPVAFSGLVTFSPNVREELSLASSIEIDSVIMHPLYDFDDGDVATDLAFVKLKKPVEGITPLALYQEGIINPLGIHEENDTDLSMLIRGKFSGYGTDISGRIGKKRTVSQLCFLKGDENYLSIDAYIPSTQGESNVEIGETQRSFHDALYKMKQDGEKYGFLHKGDSGGPLTIISDGKEFLIGLESLGASMGSHDQGAIETFQEVQKLSRVYESHLCPLFTLEGKLRPEIPTMLEKLKAFPLSPESNLKQLVQEELAAFKINEEYARIIETGLGDMKKLLDLNFVNTDLCFEEFGKIEKKYQLITLVKAKTLLEEKKIDDLKKEINRIIEIIIDLKNKMKKA